MSREEDIQELCKQILGDEIATIAIYKEYNNTDYWAFPICYHDIEDCYVNGLKNIMDQIDHKLTCGYLIAKDLSTGNKGGTR